MMYHILRSITQLFVDVVVVYVTLCTAAAGAEAAETKTGSSDC
jgi:hypothetical protein